MSTKQKELIVNIRRQQRDAVEKAVEKVKSFKYLCVHVIDNLK